MLCTSDTHELHRLVSCSDYNVTIGNWFVFFKAWLCLCRIDALFNKLLLVFEVNVCIFGLVIVVCIWKDKPGVFVFGLFDLRSGLWSTICGELGPSPASFDIFAFVALKKLENLPRTKVLSPDSVLHGT